VFADPGLEAAVRDALGQADGDIAAEDAVNLITLDATYRSIAVLDGIECLSGLQALSLDFNQITDIAPLALLGASSLSYLNLRGNQVQDLEPLSQLSALTGLSIDGNQVSDLSPLSALLSLDDLAPCKQRGE
jgi:Leucine-rich repeat (LRR) protein